MWFRLWCLDFFLFSLFFSMFFIFWSEKVDRRPPRDAVWPQMWRQETAEVTLVEAFLKNRAALFIFSIAFCKCRNMRLVETQPKYQSATIKTIFLKRVPLPQASAGLMSSSGRVAKARHGALRARGVHVQPELPGVEIFPGVFFSMRNKFWHEKTGFAEKNFESCWYFKCWIHYDLVILHRSSSVFWPQKGPVSGRTRTGVKNFKHFPSTSRPPWPTNRENWQT